MTPRWSLFVGALAALSVAAWVSAIAGAGSGTALITPSAPVPAGSTGKWSIQFTAAETMKSGQVQVTIPTGWTAPQSTGSSSEGYVTVATDEPTGAPLLSVGGQVITIDVDTLTVGNTLTIVYGDDAGGSSARATAATATGSYTFGVASDPSGNSPSPITISPALTVSADTPDHIEIAPSDSSVVAGTFSPYRLIVRDQYENRAPVASTRTVQLFPSSGQFFNPGNHSTPITTINVASGNTSVRIDYKGTLASPAGSPHTIFVLTSSGAPSLAGSDDVNVVAAALSTTQSTVSATSPIVADGTTTSSVTVTSKDAFGNPRAGDNVVLVVTGSAVKTNPGSPTDASGEAGGIVTDTVAEAVTVSATINGQAITATAPITFVAGAVSAATSIVDATTPVVANGISTSTITVTAKDANGNPVSGQSVTLSVLPVPNATLTQPGGVTNAAGVATGTLASSTIGARTVSAVIGATSVTDNAVVNFTAGPIATFVWAVDGAATAGVAESVTLTAQDAQGHTVTNFTGTVNLSTTSGGSGNTVVEWAPGTGLGSLTNLANDTATYTFAAGDNGSAALQVTDTRAETMQLNAVSGAANKTSSNIAVSSNTADVVQIVTGTGQSATVNTPVSTPPAVKVVDAYGNAVGGATVTFRLGHGGGTRDVVAGGAVDSTGVTAADGTAHCDVWRVGTLVAQNPNRLYALIGSGTTPSVVFTATATAGPGASLVITPASQNVTVGSSTIITATLHDSFGNAKSGDRIDITIKDAADGTLAVNGGDPNPTNTINASTRYGNADANGRITVLYQAPAGAGLSDIVDASTSNVSQAAVTDAVYTTTSSGATSYRITILSATTVAAGQSFHFKLEAVDGSGNVDGANNSTATLTPQVGSNLVFSLSDFGAQVTTAQLAGGVRDLYGQGTTPGNWTFTASGPLGPDGDSITITPAAIDHYDIAAINPVAAGASFNVSVTARDLYGNLVNNATNAITLAAIDDITTNPAVSSLSVGGAALTAGQATVSETYTTAESIRVRVSDSNAKIGTSNVFAVSAGAAYRIVKGTGDASNVIAGAGQVLNVQVHDLYDNPVPGATVNFVKLTGTGSIPASGVTDAAGNASQTLTTGTIVGGNTVKATILDENPPGLERVDFSVTTIAGAIANYLVSPSKTNPVAHEDVTLTISGRDANNNVRVNDSTTIVNLSKGASSAVLGATSGALTNGVFTTTAHDDVAESFIVHAQTGGASGDSPSIAVTNAIAYQVFPVGPTTLNGVTAGGAQPLVVVVKDFYGNTVAGQVVTFAIASAPDGTGFLQDGTGDPSDGITLTNASGQATASVHTALTTGANTVNAQILDGTPLAQERVTFTVNTAASSATQLVFTFIGPSTVAAGQNFSFKVEAKDGSGNLATGNTSLVTLTPEALSTLQFSLAPDLSSPTTTFNLVGGTRTLYGRGTNAGQWDITADASGLSSDTDQVNVNDAGTVASYFVSAAAGAQAGAAFLVNLEARDTYGNRVVSAGNVVNLAAVDDITTTPTGVAFGVTQATLVSGAVVVNETYTKADLIRVHASAAGFDGYSGVVTISAGPAYRVANLSGDSNSIIAGQTRTLTARVFDQYDNVVAGQLVSFAAVAGGGSTAPSSGSTSATGDVSTTLTTGTVVGTNISRATILDGSPAALETADFTVNTLAGSVANYEVTTAKTALVANEVTNVTIKARDSNGNYRPLDNSTTIAISHSGASATLGATSGTLSGGQFTTTVRDTVAHNFTVSAQTTGIPAQSGTSLPVTVTNGPAYRVVYVSGSSPPSVPVGVVQPLRTEVHDQWNNTVAGQTVTYLLGSSPPGAFVADAVNDTSDGISASLANGRAVARLHTSATAGASTVTATILDGTPPGRERVSFNVATVAGGIAYYKVTMSANSTTAGISKNVTVAAFDIDNNPVDDSVTQVTLAGDPGTGLVFGTNPLTLTNGTKSTSVTTNLVQSYQVRASTVGLPAVTGISTPPVNVLPAPPAGAITASATQNTITANGTSTTDITSGVIHDAFGNQVASGLNVNVAAGIGGTIVGGSSKPIDATGRIAFTLQSSNTVGTSTVTMNSATGTATGSINIAFAQKPVLACNTAPTPNIVVPGASVNFSVLAVNTSPTAVNLTTATTFTFTDGTHTYSANLSAPQTVPGSGNATLAFDLALINGAFTTASYAPTATLIGSDQYGSPVNIACVLPAASLLVTSIEITGIVPFSSIVSRGQHTTIAVTVKNNGGQNATINDVDLMFVPADLFTVGSAPENGSVLGAGASKVFNVPVDVQNGASVRTYQVDAAASGTVNGQPVMDNSVAPHPTASLQVITAANLAYVSSTLSPTVVSSGDPYAFQVTVQNSGGGLVVIDSLATNLTFTDGAAHTFSAAPVRRYAVAGNGGTQTMDFRSSTVPAAFVPGSYPATLDAHGLENGVNFTQSVPLTGSPVTVQAPAAVAEGASDALKPDTVSKTTTATFSVQVVNNGGATVTLTPATTTIEFSSNQYTAALNPTGPVTLPPGTTTLQFFGATVSSSIPMTTYHPTVQLTGTENGNPFSQSFTLADGVDVQNPPAIAIVNMLPSQAQFTADQNKRIQVRMVVSNTNTPGGAGANFSSASLRFIHAGIDRTSQFNVTMRPPAFRGGALLSPSEVDTVLFDVADNTGNSMTAGNMTIEGSLVVTDVNTSQPISADTDLGGKGNLQVMTPAAITFDAMTVSQPKVTQNMTKTFTVHAAVRNTGGSDAVLTLTNAATHLNFSPAPGWVSSVHPALTGGGTTLSGGEADEIVFDVTTSGSSSGPATIDVATSGVETNSGRPVPGNGSGLASVQVQTPGTIQVTNITPSRSTITSGSTIGWTVAVTLTNTGQSDIDLALGGAVGFTAQGASVQPSFSIPSTLAGGGVTLSGGETDQIVVTLTTAPTYTSFGPKNLVLNLNGTEENSAAARNGTNNGSIVVQKAPDLEFVSPVQPPVVSKLTTASFQVTVHNPVTPNSATLTLDRSLTRLRFGSSQFNVGLMPTSPVDVPSDGFVQLQFTGAVVAAGIPIGAQNDAQLELHWIQNGVTGTRTIDIPGEITVQAPPSLNIVSVRPSRSTMTRQQANAGTVTMVIRNSGGGDVDLDLSPATTHLGFKVLSNGTLINNEYIVTAPSALASAGGTLLASGATDSLVFNIAQAGVTAGAIIVNGYAGGIDQHTLQPVNDDTSDGGSGNITLQLAGALDILSITTPRSTATVGQTGVPAQYPIKMAVKNTGGAAIDVSLAPANSALAFAGTSGWVVSAPTMTGGVTLTGGETDTLRFVVTTTGGPAAVAAAIDGKVGGIENNTGLLRTDDTVSGGTGTITLQTPASLIVDSVTPSQLSVTASTSAAWNTTIALHNAGQSAARLNLPAGFSISIQNSTGGTVFLPTLDLEEGGVLLAGGAAGTLIARVTATGTFSSPGNKTLNVSIGATEVNSNRVLTANKSGSIVVQTAPNLVVTAIRPTLVTSGSLIDFEVDVQNPGTDAATVHLNRATTRGNFASGAFSAFLDIASPDSIVGGDTVTLHLESKVVPASIAVGPYNFNVALNYTANHVSVSEPEVVTNGVTVQGAPNLFIQQIVTSQPSVTRSQVAPWTATMTVKNNSAGVITLDLSPAKTFLSFVTPSGPQDNTYVVSAPVKVGGGNTLAPSEAGQILFTVTQTGTQTGAIVISGKVEGHDINNVLVSDDTFDGGRGGVLVQTPAAVAIIAVHPTQPRVTQGQDVGIRIVFANTGGADASITLAGTNPAFTPGPPWVYGSTGPLQGGGNILEGGAVDSLTIMATAGNTTGITRLDASAPWTELNSATTGTAGTASSGFGQVLIQGRADVRVLATVSASPNPNAVNISQAFNIQVTVENRGEAGASNVLVSMSTNGASSITQAAPVPLVPGGQNVSFLIPVTAASAPAASETFTTSLDAALDANSGQANLVDISSGVDRTAALAIETPAAVTITHVRPSQPSVTRGQANPWTVTMALHNAGQADVNLTPPVAGNLDFSIAGATKLDYIVQPPTKFASGATGWTLAGGVTDSLTYNVTTTGNDTGTVDIALGVAGSDRNNPPHTVNDTGATSVRVQDVAGLFIASTFPVGTFNHADASRDTVNTGFPYQIHVTVQNSGGEDVDSVLVQLGTSISPGGSAIAPATLKRQSIAAGGTHDFVYRITTRSVASALERFTATILSGVKSHNSGQPVIPQQPLDNLHDVVIQTRANLSMDVWISSPPGSVGGVVGTNQLFTLSARVSNLGQADLSGPAAVTLTAPSGFAVSDPLQQTFAADDTVRWSVHAPGAPQASSNFNCAITTIPNDVNTAAAAFVSKLSDVQSVTVSTGGALANPTVSLTAPAGAADNILSVAQNFTLHAAVTVNHVKSVVATLSMPGGYSVIGGTGNIHSFPNAAGLRQTDFNVSATALPSVGDDLYVTFAALDTITGNPVPSSADTVRVSVVPRTSLSLTAAVAGPPDALDRTVAVGTPFTVSATVANIAGAANIAAPGNLQIMLPAGYTLGSAETVVKPFTAGAPVTWVVNAAQQPSGPDQITITISGVPLDENSGLPAQVTLGTANIAMVTEGAAVSVRDVSSAQKVGTGVAPGGATKLDIMAFEISYNVTDTNVSPAQVDTVALTIIDKTGAALGASVVAQTLKRVALDLGGTAPYEVLNPTTNPVIVSLVGGGSDRHINPDGSINAIVYLDLDPSPRATEFRVRVRGTGMVVRDPGSGQKLGVTDAQGQALDLKSGPLVILSSNFQEYAHNAPNPFAAGTGTTRISYFLDAPTNVSIKIFDITGAMVYEESIPSSDPRAQAGPQASPWDGRNMKGEVVRNGIYVCVLNAGAKNAKFRIAVAK